MRAKLLLQGQYQTKVFQKDGTLVYASPVKSNFITTTGLRMISKYAIADCFRYLSIGDGTAKNSLTSNYQLGTTGLANPIAEFTYIGGRGQASDPGHATSQYSNAGFKESANTLTLFREWRVPPGEGLFTQAYNFEEFMLSPGRPFTTGVSNVNVDGSEEYYFAAAGATTYTIKGQGVSWTTNRWAGNYVSVDTSSPIAPVQIGKIISNNSTTLTIEKPWQDVGSIVEGCVFYIKQPLRLCHCEEIGTDARLPETPVYGSENSFVGAYYRDRNTPICLQTGAFARVLSTTPVSIDQYMTFTYSLQVSINSSHQDVYIYVENSRPGTNWIGYVTAKASLLHHGLKLISPGAVAIQTPWGTKMDQQSSTATWNADYEYGESFIPGWGCPLEPSTLSPYLSCYISSDRLQFAANKTGGAVNPDIGYDGSDGLMDWVSTPSKYTVDEFPKQWFNIRIPNYDKDDNQYSDGHDNQTPNPEDYKSQLPVPVNYYLPESEKHYWAQQTTDTSVIHGGVDYGAGTSRVGTVYRNVELSYPSISDATQQQIADKPVRAVVLSYVNDGLNPGYFIPYFDVVFADTEGYITIPADYWDGEYNPDHLDILKNPNGNFPTWHTLETNAALYFSFKETWGTNDVNCDEVDCP